MSDDDLMLAANWSELPGDLLGLIIDKFKTTFSPLGYIRFGAVCFEWRSFSIQNYEEHIKLPSNLPVLMIPFPSSPPHDDDGNQEDDARRGRRDYYRRKKDQTRHKSSRSFYSLFDRKVYQEFQLPVPYYKNCRGSSHGWLITVDEEVQPDGSYSYPVRLLNPFRSVNNEIQLPPLTPILPPLRPPIIPGVDSMEPGDSYYLFKALLSANPSSLSNPKADLLVLGVYGGSRFGFCRPGDSVWTHLPFDEDPFAQFRPAQDLICYKGRFLALIKEGSVLDLEFAHHHRSPDQLNITFVARPPTNGEYFRRKYLVESGAGDLLQVQRHVLIPQEEEEEEEGDDDNNNNNYSCSTIGFRVFKLNNDAAAVNDDDKWVEMDDLEGHMLFLGDNRSISLYAADFPGLMPNCIYFTDDNYYIVDPGPRDIGIYNFVDKTVVSNFDDKSFARQYGMPPPIWIQPML